MRRKNEKSIEKTLELLIEVFEKGSTENYKFDMNKF